MWTQTGQENVLLWAFVSTPSSSLLYVFIFLKHLHPHCCFHFCWRKGRAEQRGVAISFRVPGYLIGSWQHMELWGRFAHAYFWGNKYLPEGAEKERERKHVWESEKKILISLQTLREIKAGKTHPSKGCSVSCKMEIFPKLTDPVSCWQSWREEHMQAGRCTTPAPDVESALTSVHTLTHSKGN